MRGGCLAAVTLLPLASSGCTAQGRVSGAVVYDEPVVEVQTVPVAVETYPRYYYRDRYVYLVDGRWYARSSAGAWVVFREEPAPLRTYRTQYYGRHTAPPARRPAAPGYAYPPPPPPRYRR